MNVAQLLREGEARSGGRAAWTSGTRSAGYPELVDRVSRLAAGLQRHGLRPGDRVVLLLPNCPELLEVLWACFWGGFTAVPLNAHLHPQEAGYVVRHCDASAVVLSASTAGVVDHCPDGVLLLGLDDGAPEGAVPLDQLATGDGMTMHDADGAAPAWLFYTSGTTGRPKGATLSHANLWAMTENYWSDVDPVAPGSVYLHAAPLTHGSGLYLLPATGHGATNVLYARSGFDPAHYLSLARDSGATHAAFLAPTMVNRVVRQLQAQPVALPALRSVVVGGAPFYREDVLAARAALGPVVGQIYGQGEAPMTITVLPPDAEQAAADGSCGRPFSGVQVRVVDEAGTELPAGSDGEVVVRGDVVMSGYWGDPAATAQALVDGWLHTGDLGHLDRDGYLHLVDRAKDVVITGGSNVYPREVEEVLLTHPTVAEVAVVGRPDPEWGESVVAFVVAAPGRTVDARELISHVLQHLAAFKKPRDVFVVDALPKNPTGKVLKKELRARLRSTSGAAAG